MTFKKGYQPRTNRVKGDFVTDSNTILARAYEPFISAI